MRVAVELAEVCMICSQSVGFGVDRMFGGDLNGFDLLWPNIRLVNLGIAF